MPRIDPKSLQTPRERVWAAVLAVGAKRTTRFTCADVQDACKPMVLFDTVYSNLRCFCAGGYIAEETPTHTVVGAGNRNATVRYMLVKPQFDAPHIGFDGKPNVQGLGVLAMWRAMRVLGAFDFRDIARAATLEPVTVSDTTARKYVDALFYAGYLKQMRAPTRQLPGMYKLIRNTGPHAPAITRRKVVFDRNTGTFAELQTAQEVCDGLE